MDLSFAKNSVIFSQAVEELRRENADLTDAEVIKARYEALDKPTKAAPKEGPVEEVKKAPKKTTKKAK